MKVSTILLIVAGLLALVVLALIIAAEVNERRAKKERQEYEAIGRAICQGLQDGMQGAANSPTARAAEKMAKAAGAINPCIFCLRWWECNGVDKDACPLWPPIDEETAAAVEATVQSIEEEKQQ